MLAWILIWTTEANVTTTVGTASWKSGGLQCGRGGSVWGNTWLSQSCQCMDYWRHLRWGSFSLYNRATRTNNQMSKIVLVSCEAHRAHSCSSYRRYALESSTILYVPTLMPIVIQVVITSLLTYLLHHSLKTLNNAGSKASYIRNNRVWRAVKLSA